MSGALALLRRRPRFRALWAAVALSYTGSGAATTALTLYVQETRGTGAAVAAFLIAANAPRLLGPLAGGLADRLDLRTVMVGCDLGQAALFAAIATLPPFGVLIGLAAIACVLQTAYGPARTASIPMLVEADELISANALLGAASNLYVAAGPLIGGLLFAAVGAPAALLVDAATFVGSALLTRTLPSIPPPETDEPEGLLQATAAGARFVGADPVLRAVAVSMCLLLAFLSVDNVALVFLARETLGGSAAAFGVIEFCFGLGMLLGSFWVLHWAGSRWRPTRLFLLSCGLSTLGSAAGGVAPNLPALGAAEVVGGSGNGIDVITTETIIQQRVPRGMIGRVYGFTSSAISLGLGLGMVFGGFLVEATSPRATFLIAAAGGLVVTLAVAPTMLRAPAVGPATAG
ncbi:MAG TPA: MFS transporter [Solirubrobacterales bacterium]|nr:MFS transporter [Solirubrobacterales bacterium]